MMLLTLWRNLMLLLDLWQNLKLIAWLVILVGQQCGLSRLAVECRKCCVVGYFRSICEGLPSMRVPACMAPSELPLSVWTVETIEPTLLYRPECQNLLIASATPFLVAASDFIGLQRWSKVPMAIHRLRELLLFQEWKLWGEIAGNVPALGVLRMWVMTEFTFRF